MIKISIAAAALLAASAMPAQAAITINFAGGSGVLPAGSTVFQNFEGFANNAPIGVNASVVANSAAGSAARPAFGSTGKFAAVRNGGTYAVSFAAAPTFSFVLGSLDTFNRLVLGLADGTFVTYQGGQITKDLSFPSGNQVSGETNGTVSYTSNGAQITGATFSSASNSFEFDNLATTAAVPEPMTWAMMIAGFGLVGGAMRRRRVSSTVRFA